FDLGDWDGAVEIAATVESQAEQLGDAADVIQARWVQARVLTLRGELAGAAEHASWVVRAARDSAATEDIVAGFSTGALALAAAGDTAGAVGLLEEVDRTPTARENSGYPARLPEMVRTAVAAGDPGLAARLADGIEPGFPYREHAV